MRAGDMLGEFELLGAIAVGRDTIVWHARRQSTRVALKVTRPDSPDPLVTARLAHEVVAANRAIGCAVPATRAGMIADLAWLATEWCDAGDLATLTEHGGLDDDFAAAIAHRVAQALAIAHARGVVHRDLKPANILLRSNGDVFIGDFGSAAVDGVVYDGWAQDGSRARLVAQTEGFAAPEVIEAGSVEPAVDVFSFGRMLAGIRRRGSSGRDRFSELLERCTRTEPDARPTMPEVVDALAHGLRPMRTFAVSAARYRDPPSMTVPRTDGRDTELAEIRRELSDSITASEARVLLLTGPPGCGKTWLASQALAQAPSGVHVSRLRCTEAVGDWRVLRPLVASIPEATLRAALGQVLFEALTHAVGLRAASRELDEGTATTALRLMLTAISPFIITIDDLHHATASLLAPIADLRHLTCAGLVLATTRTGTIDADDLDVTSMPIGDLDQGTLRGIAGTILDDPKLLDEAVRIGIGNPLHVLEAARSLARGAFNIESANLRDLIAARQTALNGELADALALAAACGESCWPSLIGESLALSAPLLIHQGWLTAFLPSDHADTQELRFAHPFLREVAYEGLGPDQRRNLHSQLAQRLDTHPDIDPETIARHAGIAYRLGEHTLAALTARSAAASVREALDHYAVNRAADWATLLHETKQEPDLADILTAEVKNRQGDFTSALDLLLPHIERDDDIATRALTIGTETLVGLAHYEQAVQWGTRAKDRLTLACPTSASVALAKALHRTARGEEALTLLDDAARRARSDHDILGAIRLSVNAAEISAELAFESGRGGVDAIRRANETAEEMEQAGDTRGLVEFAAGSATDSIAAVDTNRALDLQQRAFAVVGTLSDPIATAWCARRLVERANDADRREVAAEAIHFLADPPVGVAERAGFALVFLAHELATNSHPMIDDELERLSRLAGNTSGRGLTGERFFAVAAQLWFGRPRAALDVAGQLGGGDNSSLFARLAEANARLLFGPPYRAGGPPSDTTLLHNEFGVMHLLDGSEPESEDAFRARFGYLAASGNLHQHYGFLAPTRLLAALGPESTRPAVDWAIDQVLHAPYANQWLVHRAIVAGVLAKASQRSDLKQSGIALLERAQPEPLVMGWVRELLR